MKILIRTYLWESPKLYSGDESIEKGEKVIVKTEYSNELGVVEAVGVKTNEDAEESILRIATPRDKEVFDQYEESKKERIDICKEVAKKKELEMKIIDSRVSLDGKQIVFVFTSDGRIDFRDLVKELSGVFKKNIRMQQIGSRDETRLVGGFGICGRDLCCVKFKGAIPSITTDMARIQQIAHRGSERMSGLCGRLMCCLAYEAEQYRQMMTGMPEIYSVVGTSEGKGTVVEVNVQSQEVKVKLENGKYVTIKKEDIK
jgi:cell fate regulator YaaT (PSP1 superfamily)